MVLLNNNKSRCAWALANPLYINYHDSEWGVPIYDDRLLFEFLILEGAQAGLSWLTILKKRDNYRASFDNFDPQLIAQYQQNKIAQLLNNSGIIRNKLKIQATITNAKAFLQVKQEWGNFANYIWHLSPTFVQATFSSPPVVSILPALACCPLSYATRSA